MGEAQVLWTNCQAALRDQVSDAVWLSTFQDIAANSVDDATLHLTVPSVMVKERVEGRYLSLVQDVVRAAGGGDLAIELDVRPEAAAHAPVADPLDEELAP